MIHLFLDDRPWFRAKSRGYGTGLPIAWQGWFLMAAHAALIIGTVMLFRNQPVGMTVAAIVVGLAPMPLYRARTEGGWHWRWGKAPDKEPKKPRRKR